jgi:hypothetical protein
MLQKAADLKTDSTLLRLSLVTLSTKGGDDARHHQIARGLRRPSPSRGRIQHVTLTAQSLTKLACAA